MQESACTLRSWRDLAVESAGAEKVVNEKVAKEIVAKEKVKGAVEKMVIDQAPEERAAW